VRKTKMCILYFCIHINTSTRKKFSSFLSLRFPMMIALLSFSDQSLLNKPFHKCNFYVFHDKLMCLLNDTLRLDVKNV
jgi:hypothetical protein